MDTSSTQETANTTGAIVFVLYVVAALVITGFPCTNLVNTYLYLPKALYQKHGLQQNVQIFAGLATLSFSVLSYHMMDYLIESYQQWANDRTIGLPDQLYGKGGLLGSASERTPLFIWTWLKTSTLFYSFAQTICKPYEHYIWTEQALLVTMGWCLFMSIEGELSFHLHANYWSTTIYLSGPRRQIRHVWAYTVIAQILPISFAQNLFSLAMLMRPKTKQPAEIWTPSLVYRAVPPLVYLIFVAIAPYLASARIFLAIVIVIRLLLLCPLLLEYFLPEEFGSKSSPVSAEALERGLFSYYFFGASYLLIFQVAVTMFSNGFNLHRMLAAINDDPSVSTLGYDYLLSLISFATWYYAVGLRKQ